MGILLEEGDSGPLELRVVESTNSVANLGVDAGLLLKASTPFLLVEHVDSIVYWKGLLLVLELAPRESLLAEYGFPWLHLRVDVPDSKVRCTVGVHLGVRGGRRAVVVVSDRDEGILIDYLQS